jgi:hypothetical protein
MKEGREGQAVEGRRRPRSRGNLRKRDRIPGVGSGALQKKSVGRTREIRKCEQQRQGIWGGHKSRGEAPRKAECMYLPT